MTKLNIRKAAFGAAVVLVGTIAIAADPPRAAPPASGSAADALPRPLRAKQILGMQISIKNNTAVGTVDDIVLSDAGEVEYLIVQTSEKKLVSVPWSAAVWSADNKTGVVDITPDQWKSIPTYTTTTYPDYFTPDYRNQTYKYYGVTPGQLRRLNRRLP